MVEEERIRNRKSYELFKDFLSVLKNGSKRGVMLKFYEELDKRNAFGSETNATYSKESLVLLFKDEGI